MSRFRRGGVLIVLVVAAAGTACALLRAGATIPQGYEDVGRPARIDPDYRGCTIPPNIAPLNFQVMEPGTEYRVHVYGGQGDGFVVASEASGIVLPAAKWRSLLEPNRGGTLHFDVFVRGESDGWRRFDTISNRIAGEEIDSYLAYRRIKPVHNIYTKMGTYQRDVSTYRETPILVSGPDSQRCVNCHTVVKNKPDTMCLHVRGSEVGAAMVVARDGKASKIDTRTELSGPAAYTAWHPNGRLAAFASIKVVQFHHSVGNSRDVFVHDSDLGVFDVESTEIHSTPPIADPKRLETFPTWSPDGKYLYFCSAPRLWEQDLREQDKLPMNYREARCDLMRISYDPVAKRWGKLEPILLAEDVDASINEPRISPDGRFLLFCTTEYGCFPVFQKSSDLCMMDLQSGKHWPLKINSNQSDSWHCWSTNSRWIAFASKRRDGLFGRVYFSYVDPDGTVRKPVLLPQEDPAFHVSCLDNFNAPELITGPIRVPQRELRRAIEASEPRAAVFAGMLPAAGEDSATDGISEPPATIPRKAIVNLADADRYYRLGLELDKGGRIEEAVEQYRLAVERLPELHPANIPIAGRLAWIYATDPSDEIRDGHEALVLAVRAYKNGITLAEHALDERLRQRAEGEIPLLLDKLAAAYAECGGFAKAVATALEAEKLALRHGQVELAIKIREHNELYLVNEPYRAPVCD